MKRQAYLEVLIVFFDKIKKHITYNYFLNLGSCKLYDEDKLRDEPIFGDFF